MSSKPDTNNHLQAADRCCLDNELIFIATYSSGRTWLICNHCIEDESFKLGLTSRTRISS